MVSRDIVLHTVKRMHSSGVDEATIRSTLRDTGLSDEEIASVIAEVKGKPAAAPQEAQAPAPEARQAAAPEPKEAPKAVLPSEEHEKIAKKTAEHVGEQIKASEESAALRETTVHATIAEQADKIGKVSRDIRELQAMTASEQAPLAQRIAALEKKLNAQHNDLGEVKAAASALQDLLKKVLSTDRAILLRLEKKR